MKIFALFFCLTFSGFSLAMEKCGEDLLITSIANYSSGSGGPFVGDLTIIAGGKSYEWRSRYGLEQNLLDQTMSLALYAKAVSAKVDFYCTQEDQTYNARYIQVK